MRSKNRFGLEMRIKEREIERFGAAGGIWCLAAEVLCRRAVPCGVRARVKKGW
jgi:hypothetical protein